MKKNHPLAYITRLRSTKDIDSAFDLVCASNFFAGQFNSPIPVDESRECWEHLKALLRNEKDSSKK